MFVASYRNTERGAQHIFDDRIEEERKRRMAAQRRAAEAEMALAKERERARQEAIERARQERIQRIRDGMVYRPSFRKIEERACVLFDVAPSELRSDRRNREIVFARQFVSYWAARLTKLSLPQIGRLMHRDHTTILHSKDVYRDKRIMMGRYLRRAR